MLPTQHTAQSSIVQGRRGRHNAFYKSLKKQLKTVCRGSKHVASQGTIRCSRQKLMQPLPLPIPTPLKLSLLARAPAWPRLRPRCCCCCCRPAAVGTPYERQQNGWLYAKLQATVNAAVESWQTRFTSIIVQHVGFNRALTPLFDLVRRCQVSRFQSSHLF